MLGWLLGAFFTFVWSNLAADGVHWILSRSGWCTEHKGRAFMEIGVGLVAATLMLAVFPILPVFLAMAALVTLFLVNLARPRGKPAGNIAAPRSAFFTGSSYHAMHRAFPDRYFGSTTTIFDMVFGTGCAVKGRKIVITGSTGSFGSPMVDILLAAGAKEVVPLRFGRNYLYEDYSNCDPVLESADILVLAHGAKGDLAMQANCDSFLHFIERFKELTAKRELPPEVWAVGSEIEAHPAWGNKELHVYLESKRAFARHARRYYWDPAILYRHIVPSAFKSQMGPGLISGRVAALWAWFFIRRGFRYVPVSYTGIALINYFKFLFRWHAQPELKPAGTRRAE